MSFSGINRALSATFIALAAAGALAAEGPRVLREPVLNLRYDSTQVVFDRLPDQALANCSTLVSDDRSSAVWFVYASARDMRGRTYYIVGGYELRRDAPPYLMYQTDGLGLVFSIKGSNCILIDSARQVFDDRLFNEELPRSILIQLAKDHARRLAKAFGGQERLRTELKNQHVDLEPLPPELADALKPVLAGRQIP